MALALFCLFSPGLTFLAHVFVERSLFRWMRPRSRQNTLVKFLLIVSGIYGLLAVWLLTPKYFSPLEIFFNFSYTFITTLGFGYAYFHFFNMSETARRIHILVLIYEHTYLKNETAKKELVAYDASKMVSIRIDRLVQMGALELKNDKYITRAGGLALMATLFRLVRPLFYGNEQPRNDQVRYFS